MQNALMAATRIIFVVVEVLIVGILCFGSHFPFGFSLEHFQASNVVDSSITPSQSPAVDDFRDIS
jgi:hypothetical protein